MAAGEHYLRTLDSLGKKSNQRNPKPEGRTPLEIHSGGGIKNLGQVFHINILPFSALCISHSPKREYD